ncbi:rab-GTPase-TBC domain-containing protein [Phyllosticta capitalensis]
METLSDERLCRTSSTNSASSSSRKSSTARRTRPRKAASNASLAKAAGTPSDDKSLTSFPSLSPSPEVSPIATLASEPPEHPQTPLPASLHTPGLPDPPTLRKISKPPKSIVGSLLAATPTSNGRSALFDDTPRDAASVPGNLHHASHDSIERMVARHGAVDLIKQLSTDLAQRDAQMTALRRKAEERERLLRKMLQECEVSNLDIEKRLRGLERGPNNAGGDAGGKRQSIGELDGVHPEDPIDAHVAQALAEQHDGERESMPQVEDDSSVTAFPTLGDNLSVTSGDFATTKQKDPKGWKSYVWTGSTNKTPSQTPSVTSNHDEEPRSQPRSRASSGSRKALSGETFMPPPQTKPKAGIKRIGSEEEASAASSRRSSGSVASWALRLVAGNNQTRDGDKLANLRGRPTANGQNSNSNSNSNSDRFTRTTSMESTKTTGTGPKSGGPRSRPSRASLGPNGTIKSLPPDSARSKTSSLGSPAPMQRTPSNIGPVEMDMILPEESRPPTLMPLHNMSESAEFLTDRFGFIYDQKRKKRQAEAAGAAIQKTRPHAKSEVVGKARESLKTNLEGDQAGRGETARPPSIKSLDEETLKTKTWQDYLKTATFPTELLSHTPSAAPITVIDADDTPKASSQVTVSKSGSYPALSSNPEPAPSHETSAHAELARPSANGPTSPSRLLGSPQPDPVKVLLEQLTDLHDSLQRDKTVKWNDFLRKVRAERKRDGDAVAANEGRAKLAMPETLLTDGEIVGIAGAGNKGKVGRAKWKEFRNLVLSGIPVAYRAKIWAECSGAAAMRVPGYYEDLVANGVDDPTVVSQIQMDINRTLTDNIFFRKGPGVHKLNEVLVAYARRNHSVGYCQGMNLITACLLLIMPTAEDAFWVLATMIENILPESYYDHSLLASRADQVVLRQYVTELLPKLSQHFDALGIELEALTFQWFLSVFTDCLSAEALFRVWDVVLCMHDGSTFLFQVALALLKLNEKSLIECDNPGAVYHYINQQMTNHAISIDGLIQASEALKKVVKRNDVEERRAKAMDREREIMKQREELRAGRLKKAADERSNTAVADTAAQEHEEQSGVEQLPHQPQLTDMVVPQGVNITPPTPTTPETMASSVSFTSSKDTEDEDYEENEIGSHTPLPIDEEVLWRA